MKKTIVLNVVGLTPDLIGDATPFLSEWFSNKQVATVDSMLPAVTCSVQATYLTGKMPEEHGIVGNGWYFREMDEIKFWRQSNKLIQSPKIWDQARKEDPDFTCANLFWWYNMNSSVDYLVTPRPIYKSDGVKVPDILTKPMELRDDLQNSLGQFPLFNFWGPNTTIYSTQWIADSAKQVDDKYDPTLTLIYLPHLDYNLQRIGPDSPQIEQDLREIDEVCKDLVSFYEKKDANVILLSEYGIDSVNRPVSLNRVLREKGYISVREEQGHEVLIPDMSKAFAVADHQIAHIYVDDHEEIHVVKKLIEEVPGVAEILDEEGKRKYHLNHERAGELVAVAEPDAWFTYYYWLEEEKAPDFAPTVDIHTKPGYDPAELFMDPDTPFPKLKAGFRLLQKKLGFRYLMDVVPTEGSMVKGSHGRIPSSKNKGPLLTSNRPELVTDSNLPPTAIYDIIMGHLRS